MANIEIISETPISMSELSVELSKIKKRDKELNFRATKTEEYITQFNVLDEKKSKELFAKLSALNVPRLKDIHIIKIMDIQPTNAEDVKLILQGYNITINQDNLKKIAKTIEESIS